MELTETEQAGTGSGRKRTKTAETAVEAFTAAENRGETLAEVTHDARNMVAALGLYCDMLEEPGVLSASCAHYGAELRLVATASRRLVEKLAALELPPAPAGSGFWRGGGASAEGWPARLPGRHPGDAVLHGGSHCEQLSDASVANLAAELLATRNLLSALAGPAIALTVEVEGGARRTRITTEDLTRVLVNLVKNASEAIPSNGRIWIRLSQHPGPDGDWLALTVEDNGPGIPDSDLDHVFSSGFSSHRHGDGRPCTHRGLGLAITRAIIEATGGHIWAENREQGGARLVIELPVLE